MIIDVPSCSLFSPEINQTCRLQQRCSAVVARVNSPNSAHAARGGRRKRTLFGPDLRFCVTLGLHRAWAKAEKKGESHGESWSHTVDWT